MGWWVRGGREGRGKGGRGRRSGECGVVRRGTQGGVEQGGEELTTLRMCRFESLLPVHHLWLGYMAELLTLPIAPAHPPPPTSSSPATTHSSATLLPTFLPRAHDLASPALGPDLARLNIPTLHAKLVKAEFVGAILSGQSASLAWPVMRFVPSQPC